jgi:hypothetical protein
MSEELARLHWMPFSGGLFGISLPAASHARKARRSRHASCSGSLLIHRRHPPPLSRRFPPPLTSSRTHLAHPLLVGTSTSSSLACQSQAWFLFGPCPSPANNNADKQHQANACTAGQQIKAFIQPRAAGMQGDERRLLLSANTSPCRAEQKVAIMTHLSFSSSMAAFLRSSTCFGVGVPETLCGVNPSSLSSSAPLCPPMLTLWRIICACRGIAL